MNKLLGINAPVVSQGIFFVMGLLGLSLILAGVYFEEPLLFVGPFSLLVGLVLFFDYKKIYYLLFLCLPISTEYYFPNGLGTDLPTEPIMWILLGTFILYTVQYGKQTSKSFFVHPITIALLLHLSWILISCVNSSMLLISIKFLLAKIWYVVAFFFFTGIVINKIIKIERVLWLILIPLLFTNLIILTRYSLVGFEFSEVNTVLSPFYRNKVNYASFMVCFLPYVVYLLFQQKKFDRKWYFFIGFIGILMVSLYYTYTRAVYVTIAGAIGYYFIMRYKLTKPIIMIGLMVSILGGVYLTHNNKYLEYAPDYQKTIYHEDFGNLLDATTKLQDLSTMERVYRWVAAYYMIKEKPLMGYGPGNFFTFYKSYTVYSFETYVSDNEEQSGVHSYYLMTIVEQGFIGLLFFLILCFYPLFKAERMFHATNDKKIKGLILASTLSLIIIYQLLIINDMVETDKVGSFFFFNLAILVILDLKIRKLNASGEEVPPRGRETNVV